MLGQAQENKKSQKTELRFNLMANGAPITAS